MNRVKAFFAGIIGKLVDWRIKAHLAVLEGEMQTRLRSNLKYWLMQQVQAPGIISQDEVIPPYDAYTIIDTRLNQPTLVGGQINLSTLVGGDEVELTYYLYDFKGTLVRYLVDAQAGPLRDPMFIFAPVVVTNGIRIDIRTTKGKPRTVTYSFYKWIAP